METQSSPSIVQAQVTVLAARELAPGYFLLSLHAPEIARRARPGQFAQLRVGRGIDPLLARPISIYRADPAAGAVDFIFKVVGKGTALLSSAKSGDLISVLGPVGNGFTAPEDAQSIALVAGGVGMPPMYFLAKTLLRENPARAISLFYGGRTKDDLLELAEWNALGVTVFAATDDGSAGHHGLVTAPLEREISRFDFIAACGPRPMLRAVQKIALAAGIAGQLSLEERMACGVGACLGCVCATTKGSKRICVDGPVFSLDEVTFHA